MSDYSSKMQQIRNRYNPENDLLVEQRSFSDLSGVDREVAKYVKMAMARVDDAYTNKTIDSGNRVLSTLSAQPYQCSYRFQGSICTDTHIKGASDIDLLTITDKYSTTEKTRIEQIVNNQLNGYKSSDIQKFKRFLTDFSLYKGDIIKDLHELRMRNEGILTRAYPVNCDCSHGKSIKVHNSALNRDVDIVTASWHDSITYVLEKDEIYRGISIYNKETNSTEPYSYPFLSIDRINKRDSQVYGRLKKMIRFLKNVRTDSDKKIDLTSFEINSICFSIPVQDYLDMYYLDLVNLLWRKLYHLTNGTENPNDIVSVDGTERVFVKNPQRLSSLKILEQEVWNILQDLKK